MKKLYKKKYVEHFTSNGSASLILGMCTAQANPLLGALILSI